MPLQRYREIIPAWDRFVAVAAQPESPAIRVRAARVAPAHLARRLEAQGFRPEPVPGLDGFFRVAAHPRPLGHTLEHWLGLFYVQEAVMGFTAPALAPRPGERVLDLCAAPGGKTGHIAELLADRGTLVAADLNPGRLSSLAANVYRLGLDNVLVVSADGRSFPGRATFDRVLVDVPCSAEGNLRGRQGIPPTKSPAFLRQVIRRQESLLRRAVALTRPGGTILYVTCTFNPDENEAVVDRVLHDAPVTVVPIPLELPHEPGLAAFEGRRFDPRLAHAWRVYPHQLDSGGLFMVRLRREGDGRVEGWTAPRLALPVAEPSAGEAGQALTQALRSLDERFAVAPETLQGLNWALRGDTIWVHRADAWPLDAWRGGARWLQAIGLPAIRRDARGWHRPTNVFLRWLDGAVRQRVVALDSASCARLLRGETVPAGGLTGGYVALSLDGSVIGRGRVGPTGVASEIPKPQARELLQVLGNG